MLKPVDRAVVSNQVFEQLRDEILKNEYRPGERLPPERELSEIFQVNRSSVREALKRLEQARLIDIQQGEGSIVLDFSLHAGFDLMPWVVLSANAPDPAAMRSVLEFKLIINPEIARFAALRIEAPELEQLERIVDRIDACGPKEVDRFQELDFLFHYTMARGSGNLTFILLYNSMKNVYHGGRVLFTGVYSHLIREKGRYRPIYEALLGRDADEAYRLCRELTVCGNEAFLGPKAKARSGGGAARGKK